MKGAGLLATKVILVIKKNAVVPGKKESLNACRCRPSLAVAPSCSLHHLLPRSPARALLIHCFSEFQSDSNVDRFHALLAFGRHAGGALESLFIQSACIELLDSILLLLIAGVLVAMLLVRAVSPETIAQVLAGGSSIA